MISVTLTIHNKVDLVSQVIHGIVDNSSRSLIEVVLVFDGCTDNSITQANKAIEECKELRPDISWNAFNTPDVFETKANNVGLRNCGGNYVAIVQDDCVIREKGWDVLMLMPFLMVKDVFAVSARKAHNNYNNSGNLEHVDLSGEEHGNVPRGTFAVRDVCIRGPLMLNRHDLELLNYLDEEFSPYTLDDHDLCYRAYKQLFKRSGTFPVAFESRPEWGTTRQKNFHIWRDSYARNSKLLIERHGTMMTRNTKLRSESFKLF